MITTEEQFREWLTRNHELLGVEFKGPGALQDRRLFGKVLGVAMRMANRRDGGVIVIGVDEDKATHAYLPTGLSDTEIASWRYDNVADRFAIYTEPIIMFNLEVFLYGGKKFIVIYVQEFDEVPVICKKDYGDSSGETMLKEGSVYSRSRGKPQTTEKVTYQDMRALLQLAAEKSVRRFVEQVRAAGRMVSSSETLPQDRDLFAAQNEDWTSDLSERIGSRGHWQIVVRPATFSTDRISDYSRLYDIVRAAQVHLPGHGWPFPYMEIRENTERRENYISQEEEYLSSLEAWRFYLSGQFVHRQAIRTDWIEKVRHQPVPPEWKAIEPGTVLLVSEVLQRLTMLYEFAGRLALSDVYATEQEMHIELEISGLAGRTLGYGFRNQVDLQQQCTTAMPSFNYSETRFSRDEVIARPKELAWMLLCSYATVSV